MLALSPAFAEWRWSGKAGLNYDFISHDYYLRTIDTLGITPDSLAELKSYSDRIDEKGVSLRLELQNKGPLGVSLVNSASLSDEKLRNLVTLQLSWGAVRFRTEAEIKSYEPADDFSLYDSRVQNSSRLGLLLLDRAGWEVEVSQEFEYTGYENRTASVYGYRQHETRLQLRRHLGDFSDLGLNLRFDHRDAYDSSSLGFSRFVADLAFDAIGARQSIMASLYGERKSSNRPDRRDDYLYLAPFFDFNLAVGEQLDFAPRLDAQIFSYDAQSLATFSHYRLTTRLELDYRYSPLSTFAIGLGGERLKAFDTEYAAQDYRESMLLLGYESLASEFFTINLSSELGYANFEQGTDEFYTDHWLVRFDLLGDINLSKRLRFSLIGSSDFEYHEEKEDDVFVYLLSGNLTYEID